MYAYLCASKELICYYIYSNPPYPHSLPPLPPCILYGNMDYPQHVFQNDQSEITFFCIDFPCFPFIYILSHS
eukprot:COSAG05_NODE_4977_length_1304_cov_0.947718_1_plen_71_part_10